MSEDRSNPGMEAQPPDPQVSPAEVSPYQLPLARLEEYFGHIHPIEQESPAPIDPEEVEKAVAGLLRALHVDLEDENFTETPRRVARYFLDHFKPLEIVQDEVEALRRAVFPSNYEGLVVVTPIEAWGICPHHLLPITYTLAIGYIPNSEAIGLSKLPRVAQMIMALPILQEDATQMLMETLQDLLGTEHVAVYVKGIHSCMTVRGVRAHEAATITACLGGFFGENDHGAKHEFYRFVNGR